MKLAEQNCKPYKQGDPALSMNEANRLLKEVPNWSLKEKQLVREFAFKDFNEAIDFVNKIAELAQAQDHHPDICIFYSKVTLTLSTHKVGGLSQNDFILAAKIDLRN